MREHIGFTGRDAMEFPKQVGGKFRACEQDHEEENVEWGDRSNRETGAKQGKEEEDARTGCEEEPAT